MTGFSKRCARALFDFVLTTSLSDRKEWVHAMRSEMEHLPDHKALRFSIGCAKAMAIERVSSDNAILLIARLTLVFGAIVWSAGHIWLAERFSLFGYEVLSQLSYVAATCIAVGAFATARYGLRLAAILIVPVLFAAAVTGGAGQEIFPTSPHNHFYQAIAQEYAVLLLSALLIAKGVPHWIEVRNRRFL